MNARTRSRHRPYLVFVDANGDLVARHNQTEVLRLHVGLPTTKPELLNLIRETKHRRFETAAIGSEESKEFISATPSPLAGKRGLHRLVAKLASGYLKPD